MRTAGRLDMARPNARGTGIMAMTESGSRRVAAPVRAISILFSTVQTLVAGRVRAPVRKSRTTTGSDERPRKLAGPDPRDAHHYLRDIDGL